MRYSKTHEWASLHDQEATLGITEHAQKELGEIVYVELPKVGYRVEAGEQMAVVESTKSAVDLYSPLAGEVVEINEALKSKPELLNQSPEKEGWMIKLKVKDPRAYETLLTREEYLPYLG